MNFLKKFLFLFFSAFIILSLFLSNLPKSSLAAVNSINIYDESLNSSWSNWSWDGNVNLKYNTGYNSNYSISFTANKAWAGLYLHSNNSQDVSSQTNLDFSLKASSSNQKYNVILTDTNNNSIKSIPIINYGGYPLANTWKTYSIPLKDLNPNNLKINGIIFQEFLGTSQPAIYIDNLSFTNINNTVLQNTQTPTLSTTQVPTTAPVSSSNGLPQLPSKWPYKTSFEIGASDSPGGASSLKSSSNVNLRYLYLCGGVNTGTGWSTWNTNGDYATYFIKDSINSNMTPVFTYYQIRQSVPGNNQGEMDGVYNNAQNISTMTSYYNDLKLFFQKAGAFPNQSVVLQVEPDFWGFMQQKGGDDATKIPTAVASTGLGDLSSLPNTLSGYAKAILTLRDIYAPNVILGYHLSIWGTGNSIQYSKPDLNTINSLSIRSANFYNSLNANFDISFMDQTDRDAGYKQFVDSDNGASWMNASDYTRSAQYISTFVKQTGKRMIIWQVPFGNTRMLAENNTWNHYQDNHVEWWLDDSSRSHLQEYINAGVVAILFGAGASGNSTDTDASGDGVTNPKPINNNTIQSYSSDDDGGFFKVKTKEYYSKGQSSI